MPTLANRSHFYILSAWADWPGRPKATAIGKSTTAQVTNEMGAGVLPTTKYYSTPPPPTTTRNIIRRSDTSPRTYTSVFLPVPPTSNMTQISIRSNPSNRFHRSPPRACPLVLFSAPSLRISACNTITPTINCFCTHPSTPPLLRALPTHINRCTIGIHIRTVELDPLPVPISASSIYSWDVNCMHCACEHPSSRLLFQASLCSSVVTLGTFFFKRSGLRTGRCIELCRMGL